MMRQAIAGMLAAVGLLLAGACQPAAPVSAAPEGEWISLFNGRDLDDWVVKFNGYPLGENVRDTFRVEDGVLLVSYDNHESFDDLFGHLYYKTRPFSHYWIRAEYRFVGEQVPGAPDWALRNNGLMLHSQPPETVGFDQDWPVSIEVRLLGEGMFGERPTGNLCAVDTNVMLNGARTTERCHDSTSPTMRGDRWVLVEAEVQGGDVVRHFINGEQVMEYTDVMLDEPHEWSPTLKLESGYIAIQAESHPTEFRRIELLNLGD